MSRAAGLRPRLTASGYDARHRRPSPRTADDPGNGRGRAAGLVLILFAASLLLGGIGTWVRALLAAALLIATVPVATQLLARGAAAAGIEPDPATEDVTRA